MNEYVLKKVKRISPMWSHHYCKMSWWRQIIVLLYGCILYQEGLVLMDEKGNQRVIWEKE